MRYFDFHRRRLAWKDHISGAPSTVSGTESVMLNATSGSKISALEIEGNTYQETEEASPIIEQAIASDGFTSTGENYIAYYITTEQLTVLQEWATDKGYTGNFVLSVSAENTNEIPTGFAVVAGSSLDDIVSGSNITTIYYNSLYDGEIKNTVTLNLSDTVYIGIGNTDGGVGEDASEYLNLFLSNFTLCLQPTEYKGMPSPENPSAIKDLNDNGVSIALQGINLLDKSKFPTTQTIKGITYTNNGDGTITANGTAESGSGFRLDTFYIEGNKTYLMRGCPKEGAANKYFMFDGYGNTGSDLGSGVIKTVSGSDSVKCSPILYIVTGNTVSNLVFIPELFDLTSIYGEGNEPTTVEQFYLDYPDYEPYFNKTVEIPSSVTLSDGETLEMSLAKVGDKANKLSTKGSRVTYFQSTKKITLTGEESGWSEAEGVYKYSLGKALIENSGYCTHFKLSKTGDENTFGVESDGITFITDVATGLENFRAWLKAKSDAGDAVQVTVALANPVEYDVTKTDFAKELLNLETSRGYNLTLKADADIAPSTLSCEYYSLENEDKQTVTVRCEKADGTPLCEPILHEVRKNTLYTVKAPEIDGYVSEKVCENADASITTEIKFTYTEAEK